MKPEKFIISRNYRVYYFSLLFFFQINNNLKSKKNNLLKKWFCLVEKKPFKNIIDLYGDFSRTCPPTAAVGGAIGLAKDLIPYADRVQSLLTMAQIFMADESDWREPLSIAIAEGVDRLIFKQELRTMEASLAVISENIKYVANFAVQNDSRRAFVVVIYNDLEKILYQFYNDKSILRSYPQRVAPKLLIIAMLVITFYYYFFSILDAMFITESWSTIYKLIEAPRVGKPRFLSNMTKYIEPQK